MGDGAIQAKIAATFIEYFVDERRFSHYNSSSIPEDAEQALSGQAGGALEEK
jgi:hypothetical protein